MNRRNYLAVLLSCMLNIGALCQAYDIELDIDNEPFDFRIGVPITQMISENNIILFTIYDTSGTFNFIEVDRGYNLVSTGSYLIKGYSEKRIWTIEELGTGKRVMLEIRAFKAIRVGVWRFYDKNGRLRYRKRYKSE